MRELLAEEKENNDRRARWLSKCFAIAFGNTLARFWQDTGGADAVIFTGGIGENSPEFVPEFVMSLEWIGLTIEADRNAQAEEGVRRKESST